MAKELGVPIEEVLNMPWPTYIGWYEYFKHQNAKHKPSLDKSKRRRK